jgi:hypothetical protein
MEEGVPGKKPKARRPFLRGCLIMVLVLAGFFLLLLGSPGWGGFPSR